MKVVAVALCVLLILSGGAPARADFKYTECARITGGALIAMAKFAAAMTKTSEQDSLKPSSTTHYVKGHRLRTDRPDGTIQIIDLDARRVIEIVPMTRSYGIATFDELKAALQQEQQFMQMAMQQDSKVLGDQASISASVQILPAGGSRLVLGQQTHEAKFRFNVQMQSVGVGPIPTQAQLGPNDPNRMVMSMICDLWLAPAVNGYQEFREFERRMAQDLNWIPPSGFGDPRMSQGMAELQKNAATLRGFPLLQFVSMGTTQMPNQTAANGRGASGQSSAGSLPPRPGPGNPTSTDSAPTSNSDAVLKGLGALFGKQKQPQGPLGQGTPSNVPASPLTSNSNSLVDMSIEVNSFSDSPLDAALFEIPVGYTQIQGNPAQILHPGPRH